MQTIREEDAHNRLSEEKQALTDSGHDDNSSNHSNLLKLLPGHVEPNEKLGSESLPAFDKAIRPSSKALTIENQTDPESLIPSSERSKVTSPLRIPYRSLKNTFITVSASLFIRKSS